MGFILTIKGQETITFGTDVITSVHIDVNTPPDSMAKSSSVAFTMYISGKNISTDGDFSNSDILKLLEWSLVPAQSADAYRDAIVEVIASDQTSRKINLPNAFIVDYGERYSIKMGEGSFSLVLRQRVDKISEVKVRHDDQ